MNALERTRKRCSQKAFRFVEANARSPVVYVSVDRSAGVTYRLEDGNKFEFDAKDAREIGIPRFAHLECAGA